MLKPMPRREYDKFVKTIPRNVCLFCAYKKYQIIIREWKNWILVQPVSPYFTYHVMLCSKRHVKYLYELNANERAEFFKADEWINRVYKKIGIKRVRMQFHGRHSVKNKKPDPNEHLHIHYYKFEEGDFKILLHKTAYKQDMKKLFGLGKC